MQEQTQCPCGSGLAYGQCCGPYHSGEKHPATAEALMRARYTAFARRNEAYIIATWDVAKRPATVDFSKQLVDWIRLVIVSSKKGGTMDNKGMIHFKAYYRQDGDEYALTEISRFRKLKSHWYYLDGSVKSVAKIGQRNNDGASRNAPCCCGSGKKYKRCCGKR